MNSAANNPLKTLILNTLNDMKAQDVAILDVQQMTPFFDLMIIASGTSSRHLKAMTDKLVYTAKHSGHQPIGVEGERQAEWILVDFGDVVVHLMHPETREFYQLEKLWSVSALEETQSFDKPSRLN